MDNKFYQVEDRFDLFDWRDRKIRPSSRDFYFFERHLGNLMLYLRYDTIDGYWEANHTICLHITPLDDDYWRIYFNIDVKAPIKRRTPISQKNPPKKIQSLGCDILTKEYWFICDGKDGVIKCLKDHKFC